MTDVILLVSGSRGIVDAAWVEARIEQSLMEWTVPLDQIALVVNGNAAGVDTIARKWAAAKGLTVKLFKPDWTRHGKAAGMIRNREMLKEATHVITLWDGSSPGTKAVIDGAKAQGKPLCSYTRVTPSI
jgi:hypothetical protein